MKNILTFVTLILIHLFISCSQEKEYTPEEHVSTIAVDGVSAGANFYLEDQVKKLQDLAKDKMIVQAIELSNRNNSELTADQINQLDSEWQQNNTVENPLINEKITNACALRLKEFQTDFPQILEVFVMDNQGLIVGTGDITSDYNQADEAKWSEVFQKADKIWYGKLEYDESSHSHGVQLSIPVKDIGAICATVSLKNRHMAR